MSDKVIQRILRQSNVNITMAHYVKAMPQDALDAMARLEAQQGEKNGMKYSGSTVKAASGPKPEVIT